MHKYIYIYMKTMCPTGYHHIITKALWQLIDLDLGIYIVNNLKAVADAFRPLRHIFMARNRVSKGCLMAKLSFHFFVYFCVPIYIFSFHHKQCASHWKDFTSVKFTSQLFSSADDSLRTKRVCYCSEMVC